MTTVSASGADPAGQIEAARPFVLMAGNRHGPRAVVVMPLGGGARARVDRDRWIARLEAIDSDLALACADLHVPSEPGDQRAESTADWVARIAVGLQHLLFPAGLRYLVLPGRSDRVVRVVVETLAPAVAAAALHLAFRIARAGDGGKDELAAAVARFLESERSHLPGQHNLPIARELDRRGIGWRWQSAAPECMLIGEARWRRRVNVTLTDQTSHLAGSIAEHKEQCTRLLAHHRMPVPRQRAARTLEAALAATREIGFPVVVKPLDRSGGVGVSVNLRTEEEVESAFARAIAESRTVVIESLLLGEDYRLLVIGGRMVAASRRLPAHIVGDGVQSVAALAAALNAESRRRGPEALLRPIVVDGESHRLLAEQGLALDSVPAAGLRVWLRSAANRSQGGVTEDVTARVHPDNAWLAVRAARLIGLDVAGIDLIAPDIARSVLDGGGGGICEVNRRPALLTHTSADNAPDVAGALVDHVLGERAQTRVPIVVIVGGAAADAAAQAAAGRLTAAGLAVGLATAAGLVAAGLPLTDPGPGDPRRVRILVDDPNVSAIVVAATAERLGAMGLGHGRCDLALAVGEGETSDATREVLRWLGRCGARTSVIDGPSDPSAIAVRIAELVAALPRS